MSDLNNINTIENTRLLVCDWIARSFNGIDFLNRIIQLNDVCLNLTVQERMNVPRDVWTLYDSLFLHGVASNIRPWVYDLHIRDDCVFEFAMDTFDSLEDKISDLAFYCLNGDTSRSYLPLWLPDEISGCVCPCHNEQVKIEERCLGCYCFKRKFLEEFITKIKKNKLKGEFYLTDIIELAIEAGLSLKAIKIKNENYWHGVNTKEELSKAQEKIKRLNGKK